MRNADLNCDQRAALGAVARREIFRDFYGRLWRWHGIGASTDLREVERSERDTLAGLEEAELIVCPPRDGRTDRYFEITDKALEA